MAAWRRRTMNWHLKSMPGNGPQRRGVAAPIRIVALPCLPIEAPDPLAVALGGSETAGLQLAAELAGLQLAPTCDPKAPAPPTS